MPTFTAIAFDRLIEPGHSKSVDVPVPNSKPPPNPGSKLERSNGTSVVTDRKVNRPRITPTLYTTPESTPLPDSPSSFSPSPYIINHKRRGPRLLKAHSQDDMTSCKKSPDEGKVDSDATKGAETNSVGSTKDGSVTFTSPDSINKERESDVPESPMVKECVDGLHDCSVGKEHPNGVYNGDLNSSNGESESTNRGLRTTSASNFLAQKKDALKLVVLNSERDSECEDFYDPQDTKSHTSNTDGEEVTVAESSAKLATPRGEFYDAWEELSSESGPQSSPCDIEMEIEKRKQAEESLNDMQNQWRRIRQQLSQVGLALPADLTAVAEGEQPNIDPAEDLCRQVYLARFVSESVGRGFAKAEMEAQMEARIESKNFEIARLWDRLHYYETMNREMCQRNQEAVEMARRNRHKRKRRQRWVWGSIAAAITLGTAALAWSYLPTGRGSITGGSQAPGHDDRAKQ